MARPTKTSKERAAFAITIPTPLGAWRKRMGVSRTDVLFGLRGLGCWVSLTTVASWEAGLHIPPLEAYAPLAKLMEYEAGDPDANGKPMPEGEKLTGQELRELWHNWRNEAGWRPGYSRKGFKRSI